MFNNPKKIKPILSIIVTVLFVWTILNEIVFTGNKVFPSPSLIFLSYLDLFSSYNFLLNLLSTFSVIYISFFLSLIIIRFKFPFLSDKSNIIKYLMQVPSYFLLIPEILIAVLLIIWFGDTYFVKLFYALIINAFLVFKSILNYDVSKNDSSLVAAKSLGVSDRAIRQKIIWKFIEPEIFEDFINKQTFIWSSIISFEFIQNYDGIGFLVRQALNFNDLSIIISVIILLSLLIFAVDKFLRLVDKKYFYWD